MGVGGVCSHHTPSGKSPSGGFPAGCSRDAPLLHLLSPPDFLPNPCWGMNRTLPEASLPERRSSMNRRAGREIHFSCVLRLQEGISRRLEFGTAFVPAASSSPGLQAGGQFPALKDSSWALGVGVISGCLHCPPVSPGWGAELSGTPPAFSLTSPCPGGDDHLKPPPPLQGDSTTTHPLRWP